MAHVLNLDIQGGLKELSNIALTSFVQKVRVMNSLNNMKWKLAQKEHLEQFFAASKTCS